MSTASTIHLEPGTVVLTTGQVGTDFGLPLVEPTHRRRGTYPRTVRAHHQSRGGHVVWFTDGTKTPPLHGRTAWLLAEPQRSTR